MNQNEHGKAVAALVVGIIAVVSCFLYYGALIGIVCGIVGIVLAVKAAQAGNTEGIRKAGFILSIVGLAISAIATIYSFFFLGFLLMT